jgi:hypothetical protein
MGTMCIKTKIKVARSGRGGPAENESPKLETESKDRSQWNKIVKQAKTHQGL